ncbi:22663_t:CDS:2, partial [Dentiscutata erythropus]
SAAKKRRLGVEKVERSIRIKGAFAYYRERNTFTNHMENIFTSHMENSPANYMKNIFTSYMENSSANYIENSSNALASHTRDTFSNHKDYMLINDIMQMNTLAIDKGTRVDKDIGSTRADNGIKGIGVDNGIEINYTKLNINSYEAIQDIMNLVDYVNNKNPYEINQNFKEAI